MEELITSKNICIRRIKQRTNHVTLPGPDIPMEDMRLASISGKGHENTNDQSISVAIIVRPLSITSLRQHIHDHIFVLIWYTINWTVHNDRDQMSESFRCVDRKQLWE